ncbi:Ig-like domain-containing protein [Brevibacillus sp. AY1]|uniref:Ig-like domain-containing protein n=1 Tax=Brevibacillus sp. AY1 TaxID=2807621 RepID=UPI002453C1ED|nr:Ig-like domain-containing protein [Brevibacillus sp. AY1]MDH4616980.1 Ig-like domain-containing protein [Brevibacillus sp. AY1]
MAVAKFSNRCESKLLELIAEYEKDYDEIVEEDVAWEIADVEIAKVEDGEVTALKKGRTTLTAYYGGKSTKINVNVK